ncbi:tRNA lysidine(34) synthetase TilS [Novosphingobium sp. Gsoil 351]|uniref:tRNA lysidine(34) synthetase TilS n=1 Tax=Novosphingobium sp. Gsoil 351 TaxID=2675225 RepID=UPI0012B45FF3|nr:tRNA lysidine(34) synthetase TilS [Novosphingobium sp. Gsoil 351]QGN54535.1 tRNA lysidine(34) synthetase TilS [Novosphingobium sp. Gsoil 351]
MQVARDVWATLDISGVGLNEESYSGFAASLDALIDSKSRVGLAVSGGPDSLALLLLACAGAPDRFEVATVDHGLRAESVAEAEAVGVLCERFAVPHATLRPVVAATGNLQANARAARYDALGEWAKARGLGAIVTAHHADDQAETLLMRLNRSAGVRGLAGMRACAEVPGHPGLPLLRPLLTWRKAALEAVVAAAGLDPARDPSNADPRFERARVRSELGNSDWLDSAALAASAAHLGEADDALAWAATREWDERVERPGAILVYRPAAPRAVRLRVVERIVAELAHEGAPRGSEIARLVDRLDAGETATLGGVRASSARGIWRFSGAPARRQ